MRVSYIVLHKSEMSRGSIVKKNNSQFITALHIFAENDRLFTSRWRGGDLNAKSVQWNFSVHIKFAQL